MKKTSLIAVVLGLLACDDPDVVSAGAELSTISGTILVERPSADLGCVAADVTGPVLLSLFDAANPPPPVGTGRPVSFIAVSASELFTAGADDSPGAVLSANYVFANVPVGTYLVSAFLDGDGDFNPLLPALAQPTAGDLLGGYVDGEGQPLTVAVTEPAAYEQITVRVGAPVPYERPAFSIETSTLAVPSGNQPSLLRVEARALAQVDMTPACTAFGVQYRGFVAPGQPRDDNQDGFADLYPRVVLTRIPLPEEAAGSTVVVEGILNPTPFEVGLTQGRLVPASSLTVAIPAFSALVGPDGMAMVRPFVPAGSYAVSVLSGNGQTWTVPGELEGLVPTESIPPSQRAVVTFRANGS